MSGVLPIKTHRAYTPAALRTQHTDTLTQTRTLAFSCNRTESLCLRAGPFAKKEQLPFHFRLWCSLAITHTHMTELILIVWAA